MLLNFSLVFSSSPEILSSGLTFFNYVTINASFLSSLITWSFLTSQVSLPYNLMLHTHVEYNLTFALKGKPLLASKGTKSLNLFHPLILIITLSNTLPPNPIVDLDKNFLQFQESHHLIICLLYLFGTLHMPDI